MCLSNSGRRSRRVQTQAMSRSLDPTSFALYVASLPVRPAYGGELKAHCISFYSNQRPKPRPIDVLIALERGQFLTCAGARAPVKYLARFDALAHEAKLLTLK